MKKSYIWFQSKLTHNISAEVLVGLYYSNTSNVTILKNKICVSYIKYQKGSAPKKNVHRLMNRRSLY